MKNRAKTRQKHYIQSLQILSNNYEAFWLSKPTKIGLKYIKRLTKFYCSKPKSTFIGILDHVLLNYNGKKTHSFWRKF